MSLSKWGFVNFTVRITLKEISFSPMPLAFSQESQALLCFHLTGKPVGKRKFSTTATAEISCSGFSPSLVLLGSLPQVFIKTAEAFFIEHMVSHESGLCLAPAAHTCWLTPWGSYTQMFREKGFVQSFSGITLKSIIAKNKVGALRLSTGALRAFWCTKQFGFGQQV